MRFLKGLFISAVLLALSACSEEGDPVDTIRYSWPVWSFSNEFVVAHYVKNPQNLTTASPVTFVVKRVSDQSERFFTVPGTGSPAPPRFWASPHEDVLVVGNPGLSVVNFDGAVLTATLKMEIGTTPTLIAFSRNQNSYFWAAKENGRIIAGYVSEYSSNTLVPVSETVILDSLAEADIEDIVETNNACAILLSDGSMLSIALNGVSNKIGTSTPISTGEVGNQRLHYLPSASGIPSESAPDFLYFLDGEGLGRINLVNGEQTTLLSSSEGSLLNYDVDPITRTLLFVTSGKQVYLASDNGEPFQILLYEHTMAGFSNDGKSVAAVGYVNGAQNALTVLQFRQ